MCYRLLRGDTLMRKVLSDSAQGISLLRAHPLVDPEHVGILGHSYGGNTVLFHGALDERIRFACSSGAACTYRYKMSHQIGIEMAEVIPEFATHFDIPDLVVCFAPRRILLVSATDDKASQDAEKIVSVAQETCASMGIAANTEHRRYKGGHALTQERFDFILHWLARVRRVNVTIPTQLPPTQPCFAQGHITGANGWAHFKQPAHKRSHYVQVLSTQIHCSSIDTGKLFTTCQISTNIFYKSTRIRKSERH
jgi:hypothetical protein